MTNACYPAVTYVKSLKSFEYKNISKAYVQYILLFFLQCMSLTAKQTYIIIHWCMLNTIRGLHATYSLHPGLTPTCKKEIEKNLRYESLFPYIFIYRHTE